MTLAWPVQPAEAIATMTSPIWALPNAPVVPTRMSVVTPSISSSSTTIPVVGEPIIVTWTETGAPFTVPV